MVWCLRLKLRVIVTVFAVTVTQLLAYSWYKRYMPIPQSLWSPREFESDPVEERVANGTPLKIPRIMHWTWKNQKAGMYTRTIKNFRLYHPDSQWKIYFWNDENSLLFVRAKYPHMLDLYQSYAKEIQRVDMVRYMVLHHYGGVYADLDFRWYRSMDYMLSKYSGVVLCPENPLHSELLVNRLEQIVMNAWMATLPSDPFWLWVLKTARKSKKAMDAVGDGRVVPSTGPVMLQTAYETYPNKSTVSILPYEVFYSQPDYRQRSALSQIYSGCKGRSCMSDTCASLCDQLLESPDGRLPIPPNIIAEHLWYHTWVKFMGFIPYYWMTALLRVFDLQHEIDIRTITSVQLYPHITRDDQ